MPVTARQRIVILSRNPELYSTHRLVEATEAAGAEPLVLDTLRCTLLVKVDGPKVIYRGEDVGEVSAVIPRIGASITSRGVLVVNHFESMNVRVLATARGIARSRDKLRCLQVLVNAGIDVPRTVMVSRGANPTALIEEVGGVPCIIKLLKGTQGVGVMIAGSVAEVKAIVRTFWGLGEDVCLQELVKESRGRDIRAFVVGDKVIASMRRSAKPGEFRSNIHRGGTGRSEDIERSYAETALKAAKVVGLEVCGVDILEGSSGPRVIEINSSPGFEGLERATGRDVAQAIIRRALLPR